MKKQIIAAAVAATMTSVAIADISITGSTKVNYTAKDFDDNTTSNAISTEHDLKFTGKSGDTTVVISMEANNADAASSKDTEGAALDIEDVYMTTKVGDINLKVGDWDNGNNFLRGSSRTENLLSASTSFGPVGVTYNSGAGSLTDKVTVKTDVAGVGLTYVTQQEDNEVVVSTNVAGVGITYHLDNNQKANTDKSSLELTGKVGDFGVSFVSIDTDSGAKADGDMWSGDFEGTTSGGYKYQDGADIDAIMLTTSVAGNGIKFIHTSVDADASVAGTRDADNNKIVVTRPLASGATFELVYTSQDVTGSTSETQDTLDLELAVSF
jgi:hypothetical protein